MNEKWPEPGELVVCTVHNVKDFGAFVYLDEYDNKEGLIHISQVAPGWVKYIRDHVREGQKTVCKVLGVDANRARIDLSLKSVNEFQRRERIKTWKNEQKASKWLGLSLKEEQITEIGAKLSSFEGLYPALEEASIKGENVLLDAGIDEQTAKIMYKIASENIKISEVNISGWLELTCPRPDGIEVIKRALKAADLSSIANVEALCKRGAAAQIAMEERRDG